MIPNSGLNANVLNNNTSKKILITNDCSLGSGLGMGGGTFESNLRKSDNNIANHLSKREFK